MKVFIYFNLHKKCWSVKALEGENKGKVIQHCDNFELVDVTFKVSQAGRERVLREKRKNVHAGVVGYLSPITIQSGEKVTYNPYLYDSFVYSDTKKPINTAKYCFSKGKEIFVVI